MSTVLPSAAIVRTPPWLWGSNPAAFFTSAGLHARVHDGAAGTWLVRTEEQRTGVAPSLVEVHHVAGARRRKPRFDQLATFTGPRVRGPMSDREQAALDRRIDHALHTKELVDAFSVFTLQSVLAPQDQLSEIAAHVHSELRAFRFEENAEEPVFPDSGVHLVRRRRELVHRIKMAGVLARVEHDSRLAAGDTSAVEASLEAGELVFASSEHLLNGSTLLDVYLGPLLCVRGRPPTSRPACTTDECAAHACTTRHPLRATASLPTHCGLRAPTRKSELALRQAGTPPHWTTLRTGPRPP